LPTLFGQPIVATRHMRGNERQHCEKDGDPPYRIAIARVRPIPGEPLDPVWPDQRQHGQEGKELGESGFKAGSQHGCDYCVVNTPRGRI